ncbi:nucleotidyltransferase domain-containing protein [Streptomyces sp. DSM 42041]|uniref:Nucleotidyltransferase domain-containing protein n=1 Tax=Streptomyces hazeniae TaxID=3075538 RepID=A0ABU2NZL1_9ACTN|nr:nucleotidyltransferase domain-containing protein [Streptomyces sp. DSM 42041]MDT0382425.1 nucleotidyltransferase domain-containing protein [Streptomyces sp. DSM 42041]
MIDRLECGEWPVHLVEDVHLFGSYARGALSPGDVDVVVQHSTDRRWLDESLHAMINGRDSYTSLKQGLRGRARGMSLQFQERDSLRDEGFELMLLWRKGEPFDLARERLERLPVDPAAGSAPRDHMLPVFEAMAQIPPHPVRIQLWELHQAQRIHVARIDLADAEPADTEAAHHLRRRWTESSPLRRAGASAVAHLEREGVSPDQVELHGRRLSGPDRGVQCFIDLGWRYFRCLSRYLEDGQSWMEVPRPHRTKPLEALLIQPRRPGAVAS